jgi:cytochrome c oxidase accessory protein FixG
MTARTNDVIKDLDFYQYDDEFRNSIATVDAQGKRVWLYPKKPSGAHHRARVFVSAGLLSLLFAGPFITIGGRPLLLLNVFERRFVIFGQVFWPQDFVLLALLLIIFFVFIILFTVVYGRIWCGWMCPQTLFMEMVFRKIEYWIDGDANEQRRLKKEPYGLLKGFRKILKQTIFLAISILIAHTVMAYLIGPLETFAIISQSPADHVAGFVGLSAFTLIFYSVFAFFREQACVVVCPYGRLQSVLLVRDSVVVAYDWLRGEPRSKLRKNQEKEAKTGDCIDCKLCVHVCPTGIDIRNGTQLECVNCTACIDACDDVMIKIDKPKGLIRYTSHAAIEKGNQKIFTARAMGYSAVLLALMGIFGFTLLTRSDVETTILKVPGTLYQRSEKGTITNLYNVEFVNKTFADMPLELRTIFPKNASVQRADGMMTVVPAGAMLKTVYFIEIPATDISTVRTVTRIGVYSGDKLIDELKIKFIGPLKKNK